jgi:dipeptidase E
MSRERQIVAMGGGGFGMDDAVLDRFVVDLSGTARPRICFVPTASGDAAEYIDRFFTAFPPSAFDASVLRLFDRDVADIEAFLGEHDVVYVGGGNTLSLLAVWRAHGVDAALRSAWEGGVVLTGMSAGANCWFEACTTDSFLLGTADPLLDGLGFAAGSFTPHYHGEPARRPAVLALVATAELPPGLACDDFAAVHIVGTEVRAAVASRPDAGVYRVDPDRGGTRETPLDVRLLG